MLEIAIEWGSAGLGELYRRRFLKNEGEAALADKLLDPRIYIDGKAYLIEVLGFWNDSSWIGYFKKHKSEGYPDYDSFSIFSGEWPDEWDVT